MTGIDIPDGCIFKTRNYNLLTPHLFHDLTDCHGDLKASVSKGRTVATLLDAEFPPWTRAWSGEGSRCQCDKLPVISFRTMAYVQANILLFATYLTPKEELFKRARTFQDSLEAAYKQDHPSSDGTRHSV